MKYQFKTRSSQLLADMVTPVSVYLKIRDRYPNSILLESSDYHGDDHSFSYLCCQPISYFKVQAGILEIMWPDGKVESKTVEKAPFVVDELRAFAASFEMEESGKPFVTNGLFGYMGYESVQYFDELKFEFEFEDDEDQIPEIFYQVFQNVIAINHFKDELHVFEHLLEDEPNKGDSLEDLLTVVLSKNYPAYSFQTEGAERSNYNDDEFLDMLAKGKHHCHIGDVFQMVLSRKYSNKFSGDEFNVYRALRSINPSPYLFYFDFGSYKIFGSSPEAQIVIKGGDAIIYPIAGTFRRTGNDGQDAKLAKKLFDDPKENSEHVMLVDLARNDLSRNCEEVKVETFKEIQFFSHVIHLVSKVTGKVSEGKLSNRLRIVGDTFPAGTLSGAPKPMAMELINKYETSQRGFYGGAIGFMSFDGDYNHAIMIRSFLSKKNELTYQAGAGVVDKSKIESELQEVHNKLMALRKALDLAETI